MSYRQFNTVEELKKFYHLPLICEDKNNDGKADERIKQKTFLTGENDVTYADKNKVENIFKHIIIFTNDRNPKKNKTLKNLINAIKDFKKEGCEIIPELHVFVAADIDVEENGSKIILKDDEEEFIISEANNTDTLVFSRLGVQGEYDCEHAVKLLQDRGFMVLNPVQYAAIASNKYETAVLLQKANIPQPNFALMTKDILYNEELHNAAMQDIYKDWDLKDKDKNEDKSLVIKILDGHGGTGVFMANGKNYYAILQTIFAVDPEVQLIIQKKEEADGGDIRVHVLTLNDKQYILAAMKRVKLSGDFRSNVSLGATAEKVKLTPEQEQIALRAAKVSKLPWCAVDIMPLVKGSNKEIGDNVVLELNASPGTDGISEVIGANFITLLISHLDNPKEFYLQDKIAGYLETVTIDWGEGVKKEYLAKLDTGNGSSASHIEVGEYTEKGKKVTFSVDGKKITFNVIGHSVAKTGDQEHDRLTIEIPSIKLGLRQANNVKMAIVKKREKSTNVLLNRDLLSEMGYVISPHQTHILTPEMEKIKII